MRRFLPPQHARPGAECDDESWAEALDKLKGTSFAGKTVALYGLGDQDTYAHEFVDGLILLYDFFKGAGAKIVGAWPTDGWAMSRTART